ncbi:hypothetical protein JGI3_02348 [Candidatus Kryptobacter tengchongensis]|uniref:metallophosphoesterase n=1 Tax=Kryptobacter tengchongensis TaxID=1643429 RepID=UPI0007074E58|nr:metallophosphoesterase [Candidatus Kryptobacter tengchongensis]CUS93105.1 hypothetical protein JGI20_01538 [Candidatus Kryptobacter tengchongensis]CUU03377.1 hypothetical protein JGI3_02348 [Candidatus Kryptobacter tengchongensis]
MLIFAFFMLSLVLAVQVYLCKKLTLYIESTNMRKISKFIPFVFGFFNLPTILIFINRTIKFQFLLDLNSPLFIYPFSIWQGATLFIFIVITLGELIQKFVRFISKKLNQNKERKLNESRRKFIQTALLGISAYAFAGSTLGTIARNDFKVEKVKIKIKNLPDELKELTIGLISDIHSGIFMNEEDMKPYFETLNSLKPDLILMPGDFITSNLEEIYPFINASKNLKAKYGIFATLGNHEFFTRQPQRIAKIIEENGVRVLRNEAEKVEINGKKFFIIGIDDLRYGADLDKATRYLEPGDFKILLSHKPYDFPKFAQKGIQLTVSGHTHGGQIVFAKIDDTYIAPASLVSKFIAGHYKLGDFHLYVTRGIGVVGLPIRLNCPPEITYITLV